MKDSGAIREAYSRATRPFIKAIDDAASQDIHSLISSAQRLSRINECAYFVLFWGQFEDFINDISLEQDGDFYKELDFMVRVGSIIKRQDENGYYQDIECYYRWRCDLAHGRSADIPELFLPVIFERIEEIAEAIERGPLPLGEPFPGLFN